MGRKVHIPARPMRIISVVPSQTELLADLGLSDQLIGITKFCIHPNYIYKNKERIGGTKSLNINKIKALKPDLIIGNKEENAKADIVKLEQDCPVWMSDIYTLEDAFYMMEQLGIICQKQMDASKLIERIKLGFDAIRPLKEPVKCAYFIWKNPDMVAGNNTFINHILSKLGFSNVFEHLAYSRYPELSEEIIARANPQVVFLSSEPYPFKEKHIQAFAKYWPKANIILVDGELFSWYGSRLLHAPPYFSKLLNEIISTTALN